jgi:hypothetical protein
VLDSVSGRRRIPPRDTAPHASKLANESRSGERYPARCRTDRCRWAASSLTAPAPTLISIRRESHRSRLGEQPGAKRSGDRAAALRPPDLVSITRGLGPATFCSVVAFLDPEPAAAVAGERGPRPCPVVAVLWRPLRQKANEPIAALKERVPRTTRRFPCKYAAS